MDRAYGAVHGARAGGIRRERRRSWSNPAGRQYQQRIVLQLPDLQPVLEVSVLCRPRCFQEEPSILPWWSAGTGGERLFERGSDLFVGRSCPLPREREELHMNTRPA